MTHSDGAGSQPANPLKKTGGTEILELVHRPGPYAFRGRFRGRGGASPRVPVPIILQTRPRGERQGLPAVVATRDGLSPLPF